MNQSIEALMQRYQHPLYRFCVHLCRSRVEADDLFQDVWLRVMKHAHEIENKEMLESWLFTIAVNLYRDRYRKAKRWLRWIKPYWDSDTQSADMERVHDLSSQPERVMEQRQEKELIREALQQLKQDHRIVLVLFYMQECSYREIADIVGIAEGTVKSRLYAAKQALKQQLEGIEHGRQAIR